MSTELSWEIHKEKVEDIRHQVQDIVASKSSVRLDRSDISHTVPGAERGTKESSKVDLSALKEIVEIDTADRICHAESGVSFSDLVKETLKHDLIPMCVSELKDITIGGAVAGCSVESMSYKYGGFHDSCVEYEVVTGTGEIIKCSPSENDELFEMLHGSFGTLGIITLLSFRLIPAKKYVEVNYVRYDDVQDYFEAIESHRATNDVDFMDGIIHGTDLFVLSLGIFRDEVPYSNTYTWNIYYKSTAERKRDYIPTYDYFFRYDADCHWVTKNYGLDNKFARLMMGPILGSFILGSKNLIRLANNPIFSKKSQEASGPEVIVDVFIPIDSMGEFFDWYVKEFDYFPVWIVPYYIENFYPWINPEHLKGLKNHFFIDFAIYGFQQPSDGKNYYRMLEEKVKEVQGVKTLISHNYYPKEEFWEIHNKELFDRLKERWDPSNIFQDLYKKMVKNR